jgi:hypothetical protein
MTNEDSVGDFFILLLVLAVGIPTAIWMWLK